MRVWKWVIGVLMIAGLAGCGRPDAAGSRWIDVGNDFPEYYGVTDFAISPAPDTTLWMTTYQPGGIFRSLDGGVTWTPQCEGLEHITPLSVLAGPDGTIFVGSYLGLHRLSTEGKWESLHGLPAAPVYVLAMLSDGSTILAGVEAEGLFRSRDAGASWENLGPVDATVLSLAVNEEDMVYAGTAEHGIWTVSPSENQVSLYALPDDAGRPYIPAISVGADGSLYALIDGRLWRRDAFLGIWSAIGPDGIRTFGTSSQGASHDLVYAVGNELLVSHDGGTSWKQRGAIAGCRDALCLEVDPVNPAVAYMGTLWYGAYHTTDAGQTWSLTGAGVGRRLVTAIAADPGRPERMYAGTINGVFCSNDAGATWSPCSDDLDGLFVQAIGMDPQNPDHLFFGANDGLYRSTDAGATCVCVTADLGAMSVFEITMTNDAFYAGSWGHNILVSNDRGATWASIHHGLETQSIYAVAVNPDDASILYAGAVESLFRSLDGGSSWQTLTAGWPGAITTFALLVDAVDSRTLFAGTTCGIYLSHDGGDSWMAAGLQDFTVTALLQVQEGEEVTLYAGTEHSGLYRSDDGGALLHFVGLEGRSIYALYYHAPEARLWAATDDGLFRSP